MIHHHQGCGWAPAGEALSAWLSYHSEASQELLGEKTTKGPEEDFHVRIRDRKVSELNAEKKITYKNVFDEKRDKRISISFPPTKLQSIDPELGFKERITHSMDLLGSVVLLYGELPS